MVHPIQIINQINTVKMFLEIKTISNPICNK